MRKVLLTTDFSNNAHLASEYALLLYGDESLEFLLINTVELLDNIPEMLISIEDILQEQSEKGLAKAVDQLKTQNKIIPVDYLSAYGELTAVISQLVLQHEIDLIVLGCQGSSPLGDIFLGSTALQVIDRRIKPVLVVPPNSTLKPPNKIVLGIDNSPNDQDSIKPLKYIANKYQSEVTVISLDETVDSFDGAQYFSNYNDRTSDPQTTADPVKMVHVMQEESADLMAIWTHKKIDLPNLLRHEQANGFMQYPQTPVLIL